MKKLLAIIVFMATIGSLSAQYVRPEGSNTSTTADQQPSGQQPQQQGNFWSHVSIGGNFGLAFGNDYSYVDLSPLLYYHFNDNFMAGAGPMYTYFGFDSYSYNVYGGRVASVCFLPGSLSNVFIQGEYEVLNVPDDYSVFANKTRATVGIPLAGAGVRRPIGQHSYLFVSALWDLSGSALSPYYYMFQPMITLGIDAGI